jgi:hypothetical protein
MDQLSLKMERAKTAAASELKDRDDIPLLLEVKM